MTADGPGSSRIVLVRQRPANAAAAAAAAVAADRRPGADASPRGRGDGRGGWTVRRLTIGAALGGTAALVGGVLFAENFTLLSGSRGPLLAVGFGLFVVGVALLCGCLVGLTGAAIAAVVRRRGWPATALLLVAALALLCLLWAGGLFGVAVPGVFLLVIVGGLLVAMTK